MKNPYCSKLVCGLSADWFRCVRSRRWRQHLSEELNLLEVHDRYWGSVTAKDVIDYVSGIVIGETRSSTNVLLFDYVCHAASSSDVLFDIAVRIQVHDSLGWIMRQNTSNDCDDLLSAFSENVMFELKKEKPLARWRSANVRRNARRRTAFKFRLEASRASKHVSERALSSVAAKPQETSLRNLVTEVADISGESLERSLHTVLFYGYGLTMNDLRQRPDPRGRGWIEYGFGKVFDAYRKQQELEDLDSQVAE